MIVIKAGKKNRNACYLPVDGHDHMSWYGCHILCIWSTVCHIGHNKTSLSNLSSSLQLLSPFLAHSAKQNHQYRQVLHENWPREKGLLEARVRDINGKGKRGACVEMVYYLWFSPNLLWKKKIFENVDGTIVVWASILALLTTSLLKTNSLKRSLGDRVSLFSWLLATFATCEKLSCPQINKIMNKTGECQTVLLLELMHQTSTQFHVENKPSSSWLTWYFSCNSSVSSFSISINFLLRVASSACSNYKGMNRTWPRRVSLELVIQMWDLLLV